MEGLPYPLVSRRWNNGGSLMANIEDLAEMAERLDLIARELRVGATALSSKLTGESRKLNAWADRLDAEARFLKNALERETDQPELQDKGYLKSLVNRNRPLLLAAGLFLATLTSTLADAPAALDTAEQLISASSQHVEEMVSREDSDTGGEAGTDERSNDFFDAFLRDYAHTLSLVPGVISVEPNSVPGSEGRYEELQVAFDYRHRVEGGATVTQGLTSVISLGESPDDLLLLLLFDPEGNEMGQVEIVELNSSQAQEITRSMLEQNFGSLSLGD